MARPQTSPILAQLRNAKTCPEQTAALQALKNEIVGHIQKKEAWIALGVLEPIVRSLSSTRSPSKQGSKDVRSQLASRPLSEEDRMRLQALQLIACFAKGGSPFLQPLHAARALPAILTCISPATNSPQIVVSALKALTDMADAATVALPSSPIDIQSLADNILTPSQHLESLCLLFTTTSPKHLEQSQIELASGLICRLCKDERHQHSLATSGVLDMLATQLARFAVGQGHVVPGAEAQAYSDGLFEVLPEPAHKGTKIGPILDAISAILGDSKYRATRLVNSPAILAVFPAIKFDASNHPEFATMMNTKQQSFTAMDYLLPAVPPLSFSRQNVVTAQSSFSTPDRSDSRTPNQTPLARFGSSTAWDAKHFPTLGVNENPAEEPESPLIPWLVLQTRLLHGYDRLIAASVLAALFRAGLGRKGMRDASLGLLVVPILADLIANNDKEGSDLDGSANSIQLLILERAPTVLARLITDCECLQKAAYECGAVKILTKLLRRSYQPLPSVDQPKVWSPQPDSEMEVEESSALSRLGEPGQNPILAHHLRLRESVLKAIGAVAAGKEEYRKDLVEEDFVPYVVESLAEFPRKPRQVKDRSKEKPTSEPEVPTGSSASYGTNPMPVLIAACHVVRMLSRSINIQRTVLVDHAVAVPIFRFMTHPDVNVQIAASATICNLVVQSSPVRELLTEAGVMKVLCDHAHSNNPALRLNALWALKHFIHEMSPELKKACLEQLEPGWLVQLICDESQHNASYGTHHKESPVDDLDEDMDAAPSDEPFRWLYASNGSLRELDASRSSRLRQAEDRLASIREAELNPIRRARNDDIAIQEQGLDFVRNLLAPGPGLQSDPCDTTEMIDYFFSAMGQERLFEILASKLRAKVLHPFSRRASAPGRETRVLHPQTRIISVVIFILVHIAASTPRHRQLVIAQTELLKLLCQQASSKDKEVRVALCHLVVNLTDRENDSEVHACSLRAQELKKLGFYSKMETLRHQDRELDVRERARAAVDHIEKAVAF